MFSLDVIRRRRRFETSSFFTDTSTARAIRQSKKTSFGLNQVGPIITKEEPSSLRFGVKKWSGRV